MVYSARVLIPPHLVFATPRKLPKAASLQGRVVVLDVAFASSVDGYLPKPFTEQQLMRTVEWAMEWRRANGS